MPSSSSSWGALQICSFVSAVAKEQGISPATGREDLAAWLADEAASVEDLAPMLRGMHTDGTPTLNEWGLSVDDALALPVLVRRVEKSGRRPDDVGVVMYIDGLLEAAGLVGLFGSDSD